MKKILIYIPVVLSLLVLGAHFLRYDNFPGVFVSLALIAMLMVRRPWVARLLQLALVLGGAEWLRTGYMLVQMRAAHGEPFTRMIVILAAVAAFTMCSALMFQSPFLKSVYGLERRK